MVFICQAVLLPYRIIGIKRLVFLHHSAIVDGHCMIVERPGLFLLYEIEQKMLLMRATEVEYWCAVYANRGHGKRRAAFYVITRQV